MKKWAMAMGIILLAASLCGAEEPANKADSTAAPAVKTEKAAEPAAVAPEKAEAPAPAAAATEKAAEPAPAATEKAEAPAPKVDKDKVSYMIGFSVGRQMKSQGIELNADPFLKGLNDSMSGAKAAMTDEEMQQITASLQVELAAKKAEEFKKLSAENKKKEEAFLAENKTKEGVRTLPSGLQYKVIKEGDGKKPTAYDSVTVNYKGSLLDGTEFDSSYKRNEPATLPVGGMIPGWTEALQLMKTGSQYQIVIPSSLAYGETGAGGIIPPNAALIFEVELLSVKPAADKDAPKTAKTKKKTSKNAVKPAPKAPADQGAAAAQ